MSDVYSAKRVVKWEIVEIAGDARTDIIKHIAGPNALDRAIKSAIQHRLHQPEDE